MPRAYFTEAGLQALIALANDRRAFQPPERYAQPARRNRRTTSGAALDRRTGVAIPCWSAGSKAAGKRELSSPMDSESDLTSNALLSA